MAIKVLVCGGRDFKDYTFLKETLDSIHESRNIELVMHGNAKGADNLSDNWSRNNQIKVVKYPATWQLYGPGAGPIRNQAMLDEGKPDLVVAFAGGRGTLDMVSRAVKAGVEVIRPLKKF